MCVDFCLCEIPNCQDIHTFLFTFGSRSTAKIRTEQAQKQQDLVHVSANDRDTCRLRNSNESLFNAETNETVCSKCGMVVDENTDSLGPEWRTIAMPSLS
jgi:hypothetical protein